MDTKKQEEPFISPSGVFVATETAIANFAPDCNENLGITFFRGDALTFKEISVLYEYARSYESRYPGFLAGENPFTEDEFFTELAKRNIELEDAPEAEEQYIILGTDFRRVNWQALIPYWNRAKIYTQNGFLSFLDGERISRDDEDEIDFFLGMCKRHSEGYFEWPHTDIYPSEFLMPEIDSPKNGIFGVCGYRVGNSGLAENKRHMILAQIFHNTLPFVQNMDYMEEWGKNQSPARLEKMANSVAAFARNFLRQKNQKSYDTAIREWIDDLAWLKREYYDKMAWTFAWPKVK